jgi:hypothetical protein
MVRYEISTLYFFLRRIMSGKCTIDPSILNTPSTTMRIFFHGLRVRGCPYTTASRSSFSRLLTSIKHNHHNEYYLLQHNTMQSTESQPTFWRNISPPSSRSNNLTKTPAWAGGKQSLLATCSAYSTLKMEAICSSKMLVSQKIVLFITTGVRTSNPIQLLCLVFKAD